jgi:hypothetical protein
LIAAAAIFSAHSKDVTQLTLMQKHGVEVFAPETVHNKVPPSQVAATLYPQIIGQGVGIFGGSTELAVDGLRHVKLRKHGLDQHTLNKRILELNNRIDALICAYSKVTQTLAPPDAALRQAELNLLKDIRNMALSEYIDLQVKTTGLGTYQIVLDSIGVCRNTVGLIGNSINAAAVLRNDKLLDGNGTILNMIAASQIITRPFFSNACAAVTAHLVRNRLQKLFPVGETVDLQTYRDHELVYKSLLVKQKEHTSTIAIYEEQSNKLDAQVELEECERKRSQAVLFRTYIREPIYGQAKLSQSVLGEIINFRRSDNATSDNKFSATGNIIYTAGQGYNLCELVRERFSDEIRHRRHQRAGLLPSQKIDQQCTILDTMIAQLDTTK